MNTRERAQSGDMEAQRSVAGYAISAAGLIALTGISVDALASGETVSGTIGIAVSTAYAIAWGKLCLEDLR